ncbi:MAG: toxin-antitoxin system HicB family antitoxin [Deltaproteobacteria bacterium]|nr:toxin-antitoxin system HicB family antitoxin [Deltaproteobacteria bacterium]
MTEREADRKIHVRLTDDLHRRLRVRCAELDTSIQDWVVELLERELGRAANAGSRRAGERRGRGAGGRGDG